MKFLRDSVLFPPAIVFGAIMIVVFSSFLVSLDDRRREQEIVASDYTEVIENSVRQRIEVFEEALRSEVGFVTVNDTFSKEDWRLSIEASQVLQRFPGIQGIGYVDVITPNQLVAYEQEAKRTVSPDFSIYPRGERDTYTAVRYLEPQSERSNATIGFDMFSEPTRRATMSAARDNNDVFITSPVELVQETEDDKQLGLLLYAPSYKNSAKIDTIEQRRDSIDGYVFIVLKTRDFLSNLLNDKELDSIGFSFYAIDKKDENHVLYESSKYQEHVGKQLVNSDRLMSIKGAQFGISAAYNPSTVLPESFTARSSTILFFGTLLALLITGVTYLLLRGKANELALSQERTINDAKDSLLSIASHQLRTPATGVKQYLGMVLQGFVGDVSTPQKGMLEKAYESNERQLKTINDVLFLARLDSGRIVLSKNNIDIKEMIHSIVEEQKDNAAGAGHTIKVELPHKKVEASIDEHMIRMTLENLLSNAIKYTKNGGKISIAVKQTTKDVRVVVKDNGVGIAVGDEDKLFKQFSRIKNALSKSVSGTGIGLYLAKHIVDLHGGEIKLESEQDKGSEFTVILPR